MRIRKPGRGFASPDSDYDVRFIYKQVTGNYLSIRERRDVIEVPINQDLDINGWDIRKALQLFLKSNAPLYEWLQSPIVYREQTDFTAILKAKMSTYFSSRAGCHHYLSMARNTLENDLNQPEVRLKKYFYALRPALAAAWILQGSAPPPMDFGTLRTLVKDDQWHQEVDRLLALKVKSDEKTYISAIPFLQDWLINVLATCKQQADQLPTLQPDITELDEIFRKTVLS